jgi:hypothetical protein
MDKDETDVSAGSLFDQFRGRYLPRVFIFTSAFTIDVVEYWVILMGNLKMHIVKSFVHRRSTKFVLCLLLTLFKFELFLWCSYKYVPYRGKLCFSTTRPEYVE